jgi:glycerophosphoryl diester phosphodiesterase
MSLNAPAWLIAQPIAHRGLHDIANGIVENTLAAAEAAAARAMTIECDVQASADGEAMVFHDETLDRLTHSSGPLSQMSRRQIENVRFREGSERIPAFSDLLGRIGGRTPILCEIKSGFDGDMRLADRIAEIAAGYDGPLALKSFDPAIPTHFRGASTPPGPPGRPCPVGVVAEASYEGDYWRALSAGQKASCANFLHYPQTRPDFLSFCVDDLPHSTPFLLRNLASMPVMAWTVRTKAQQRLSAQWADQMIFEGDLRT